MLSINPLSIVQQDPMLLPFPITRPPMCGVRLVLDLLGIKNVTLSNIRGIWAEIPHYGRHIDEQVEINAHYSGYLPKQESDIKTFKRDEGLVIPTGIDYDSFSGLSNEVKSKLKLIRPKTLGQALRIDGVTPAAAIILLSAIKKAKNRVSA